MTQVPELGTAEVPDLMTAGQVGEALGGISDETVNRWARLGKIPCITLPSGQRRFRRAVVEAILAGDAPETAA